MEPMDYTMDEGHSAQQHNAASRCPAMQTYQTPNSFGSRSSGDAHHYDPVHNTDIWYPGNASNGSNRHPYTAPQNISPWGHPGALNSIYSRQGFMEGHPGGLGSEGSGSRSQASFVGLPVSPWADARDSFNYGAYVHGRSSNNGLPDIGISRTSTASSSTRTPADHASFDQTGMLDLSSRPNQPVNSSGSTDTAHPTGRSSQTGASESRPSPVAVDQATQAPPYTAAAPRHNPRSAHMAMAQARRRRLAAGLNGLDTGSPSDSNSDEEVEILRRQRRDEELLASIQNADEERLLATMRANIAASKRVPSKEALASIERLDVNDLAEGERTCIICYNDFGVVNPEGAIEKPNRLPKCKHIFGDKCIKKWFEENDSCPYCRDKLPSTVNYGRSHAIEQMRMMRATQEQRAMLQQAARARNAASASRDRPNDLASRHENRYDDYYNQLLANSGRPMEPWTMGATPQSDAAESRRRQSQARGRISNAPGRFGRPSSAVGTHSPRVFSNDRGNPPRGSFELHLDPSSSRPHPSFGLSASTPRRSITPGLPASTGSANQTPTRHHSSNAQSSSPEEASPAVAVGSRVSSGDQRTLLSSIGAASSFDFQQEDYQNSAFANPRWSEQFGNFLSQNDENLFSPPGSSSAAAESVYRQHLANNQMRRPPFGAMHEETQYPTSQNNPSTESRPRLGRTTSTDPDPYRNNPHLYMPDLDQRDSTFNHSQMDSPGNDGRSPMGWPR